MDQKEYKKILNMPNVFRRSELEEIAEVVRSELPADAQFIQRVLDSAPIDKPTNHVGGMESDWFMIQPSEEMAGRVLDALGSAEAAAVSPDGATTAEASRIASLLDRWSRQRRER